MSSHNRIIKNRTYYANFLANWVEFVQNWKDLKDYDKPKQWAIIERAKEKGEVLLAPEQIGDHDREYSIDEWEQLKAYHRDHPDKALKEEGRPTEEQILVAEINARLEKMAKINNEMRKLREDARRNY